MAVEEKKTVASKFRCPTCSKEWESIHIISTFVDKEGNLLCPYCIVEALKKLGVPTLERF